MSYSTWKYYDKIIYWLDNPNTDLKKFKSYIEKYIATLIAHTKLYNELDAQSKVAMEVARSGMLDLISGHKSSIEQGYNKAFKDDENSKHSYVSFKNSMKIELSRLDPYLKWLLINVYFRDTFDRLKSLKKTGSYKSTFLTTSHFAPMDVAFVCDVPYVGLARVEITNDYFAKSLSPFIDNLKNADFAQPIDILDKIVDLYARSYVYLMVTNEVHICFKLQNIPNLEKYLTVLKDDIHALVDLRPSLAHTAKPDLDIVVGVRTLVDKFISDWRTMFSALWEAHGLIKEV